MVSPDVRAILEANMPVSRRQFLVAGSAAIVAGAAGLAYSTLVEPRWPELTRVEIPTRWLSGSQRLRILHLSDLHASRAVPLDWLREVFREVVDEKPDCICITGDFTTTGEEVDTVAYTRLLTLLADAAPCFASMGNHDGGKWKESLGRRETSGPTREMLSEARITVPHNTRLKTVVAGVPLDILGLGDLWAKEFDSRSAFRGLSRQAEGLRVVLSHNPDTKGILQYYSWELMLGGHTHGGQIVLPVVGPPVLPVEDRSTYAGLYTYQGRRLYVSRGVGGVFGGMRFNCRPEITVLDLVPGDSPRELTEDKPRQA
jgi:uncharacterized protein